MENENLALNPSVKGGLSEWTAWSESEGSLRASFDPKDSYDSELGSLKIVNLSNEKWSLTQNELIRAKPKEHFIISAALKSQFYDRKSFAMVSLTPLDLEFREVPISGPPVGDPSEPFKVTVLKSWAAGKLTIAGTWDWREMNGFFSVPHGAYWLQLSLRGQGKGMVWFDALRLKRGVPSGVNLNPDRSPPSKTYPKAVLYKRIVLGDYAGRNLRMGDINGDGNVEFVMAQKMDIGRNEHMITCLTAIDLEGKILWQIGKPDLRNFRTTSDIPIQVYDIDKDGKCEIIFCRDFKIFIADGATGEVRAEERTPKSRTGYGFGSPPSFPETQGDSITICNLSGSRWPQEFTLKDRYNNLWAYDKDLNQLWSYTGRLPHFVVPCDVDGDGKDEVFAGDAVIDQDGKPLWVINLSDHCDSAVIGEIDEEPGPDLVIANQDGGFYFLDALTGRIRKEWHLGHAQGTTLAKFRSDIEGLQIVAQTYWGGAYWFMFNRNGNMVEADFDRVYGWVPVNWTGDGEELMAAPEGLYDGHRRLVVPFPDYLEPDIDVKLWVYNICGDPRDEVIRYGTKHIDIYTQSKPFVGRKIYTPKRKLYNQTFYCSFKSEPAWTEIQK